MYKDWSSGLSLRIHPTLIPRNTGRNYVNIDPEPITLRPAKQDLLSSHKAQKYWHYSTELDVIVSNPFTTYFCDFNKNLYLCYGDNANYKGLHFIDRNGIKTKIGIKAQKDGTIDVSDTSGTVAGELEGTYSYTYTFYNSYLDMESSPLDEPTDSVTVQTNGSIQIDINIDVADMPDNADKIRLYRLGGKLATFNLIKEFPLNTNTIAYVDKASDDDVAGNHILDTIGDIVPDDKAQFITEYNTILFYAVDNKLYMSDTAQPLKWRASNFIEFKTDITGMGATQNGLLVFTRTSTYIIVGNATELLSRYLLDNEIGCINHRTISYYKNSLVWVSLEGICFSSGGDIQVVSKDELGIQILSTENATVAGHIYYLTINKPLKNLEPLPTPQPMDLNYDYDTNNDGVLVKSTLLLDIRYNKCFRLLDIFGTVGRIGADAHILREEDYTNAIDPIKPPLNMSTVEEVYKDGTSTQATVVNPTSYCGNYHSSDGDDSKLNYYSTGTPDIKVLGISDQGQYKISKCTGQDLPSIKITNNSSQTIGVGDKAGNNYLLNTGNDKTLTNTPAYLWRDSGTPASTTEVELYELGDDHKIEIETSSSAYKEIKIHIKTPYSVVAHYQISGGNYTVKLQDGDTVVLDGTNDTRVTIKEAPTITNTGTEDIGNFYKYSKPSQPRLCADDYNANATAPYNINLTLTSLGEGNLILLPIGGVYTATITNFTDDNITVDGNILPRTDSTTITVDGGSKNISTANPDKFTYIVVEENNTPEGVHLELPQGGDILTRIKVRENSGIGFGNTGNSNTVYGFIPMRKDSEVSLYKHDQICIGIPNDADDIDEAGKEVYAIEKAEDNRRMYYHSGILTGAEFDAFKTNKDVYISYKAPLLIEVLMHTEAKIVKIAKKQLPDDRTQYNLKTKGNISGYGISYIIIGEGELFDISFPSTPKGAD